MCDGMSQAQPGIGVVPPGAADLVGLLQDQEVDAAPLQLDAHAEPGEPRADDQCQGAAPESGRRSSIAWSVSTVIEEFFPGNAGTG